MKIATTNNNLDIVEQYSFFMVPVSLYVRAIQASNETTIAIAMFVYLDDCHVCISRWHHSSTMVKNTNCLLH